MYIWYSLKLTENTLCLATCFDIIIGLTKYNIKLLLCVDKNTACLFIGSAVSLPDNIVHIVNFFFVLALL